MEETSASSPASSRQAGSGSTPSNIGQMRKSQRHVAAAVEDEGPDPIECTGRSCQSCTGGLIADCVAVCCCPCAVVDILAFTFLKVPYLMGRKWLTRGRKKMKRLEKKKKTKRNGQIVEVGDKDVNSSSRRREEGGGGGGSDHSSLGSVAMELGEDEELEDNNGSARLEAEESSIWLELYRIGHLGFGRVSFTGVPSQVNQNYSIINAGDSVSAFS